jgi:sulfide:quinone oxidoreductase
VAGLEFLLGLAALAPGKADVALIAPDDHFVYRPLAVGVAFEVAEPFRIDVDLVASHAAARRFRARIVSVDPGSSVAFGTAGEAFPYDVLVVATGARAEAALPGALTFGGDLDAARFRHLLRELDTGAVASVAFAVPEGFSWSLPLYELALLTAAHLGPERRERVRLVLVTREVRPLEPFGRSVSDAVRGLLEEAGVEVHCDRRTVEVTDGRIRLTGAELAVERVVTVPRLSGPHLAGLPRRGDGFLPADRHGLVSGTANVYAAGDATAFPVKHGGIAVEQAAAVAEAVAARLGAPLRPKPFRPVLRGLLVTGHAPQFLWADLDADDDGADDASRVAPHPLWWPPGKIAGGRLGAFLHEAGLPVPPPPAGPATAPEDLRTPEQSTR